MNAVPFKRTRPSDYLTRLAASDWGRAYKSLVIAELDIRSGNTALDLGCGPGAARADVADIHPIALPDMSVDRVHTDRILQHVADPRQLPRIAGEAVSEADQIFGFPQVATRPIAVGYLSEPAAAAWLDYLGGGHAFLAATTLFVTVAAPASDR